MVAMMEEMNIKVNTAKIEGFISKHLNRKKLKEFTAIRIVVIVVGSTWKKIKRLVTSFLRQ